MQSQNLRKLIKERLSPESLRIIGMADEVAEELQQSLYMVGGAVRDLLLGRNYLDFDLVTEGDVTTLASILAERLQGRVLIHRRFGTAKVRWNGSGVDLAMARAETYDRPGALPKVHPGSIEEDLQRRDFTINSMAVHLDRINFGEKVDPYGGEKDLNRGLIRILHERSFVDDPTRMFRAVRYEERFCFQLEPETERLLRSNTLGLHDVSGDRVRHELELIMKEESPERALQRAQEVGLLKEVHAKLKADGWLRRKYQQARTMFESPSVAVYFGLLSYSFTPEETEKLISQLKLPRTTAAVMRDSVWLKNKLAALEAEELAPSTVCRILLGCSPTAIMTCAIATDSDRVRERLQTYATRWRYLRISLDGRALQNMGVPPGPKVGDILGRLREAKLDGLVKTREDELRMVDRWLTEKE